MGPLQEEKKWMPNSEIVLQDLQTLDFVGLPQAFDLLFKSQIITNLPLYYRID